MYWVPAAFLLAVLAACTNPIRMHKAGATAADYERDKKVCEAQASRAVRGQLDTKAGIAAHNRVLLGCMRERGWEQIVE